MIVHHFNRDKRPANYTFEQLFGAIQAELSKNITIVNNDLPSELNRIEAILWAKKNAGKINHITGDVHFLAYAFKNKTNLLTIHDIGYYKYDLKGLKKKIFKKFWLTDPCRISDKITVISNHTKSELLEELTIDPEKIIVIHNPLLPGFQFKKRKINSKPVILQVGSGANKNVLRLIEASKGLDVKLLLINKFFDKAILEKLIANKIDYEQRVDLSFEQLLAAYEDADMLYFASEYEGFGMPIIESQAIGRPVITSNCSSMPEIGGLESSVFVNPLDVDEIRNAICKLIEDQEFYKGIVEKGIKNVERFSLEAVSNQYAEVYKSLGK
jgi:glycosyltransferase involved in cell wall biosynthesis